MIVYEKDEIRSIASYYYCYCFRYCVRTFLSRLDCPDFLTVNSLFGNFLNFIIPLLILGLVAPESPIWGKEPDVCC